MGECECTTFVMSARRRGSQTRAALSYRLAGRLASSSSSYDEERRWLWRRYKRKWPWAWKIVPVSFGLLCLVWCTYEADVTRHYAKIQYQNILCCDTMLGTRHIIFTDTFFGDAVYRTCQLHAILTRTRFFVETSKNKVSFSNLNPRKCS